MWWRAWPLLVVFSFSVAAHGDEPLSLEAAVEQALQAAPQLRVPGEAAAAARSLAVSAGRLPDPELVIGVENWPVTGADAYSTTSDFMTMRKLGVMQAFPRAKKRRLQRELALAEAEVADAQLVESRLEIAREVARAWIGRATAEASLNELRALEPEVELQAVAARAAVASGRGSTAEALAAEASVAQLSNRILRLQGEARRAVFELQRWIDADATRPLGPMPSFDELPAPREALLANAREHGSLLTFESQIEAAQLEVALARAERRPDWSAELAYGKRGSQFSDMVSLQFRVGLPLFSRYRQNPAIGARQAELRRMEAEREAELRMHTAELQQMLTDWEVLGEQLQRYERELLPLARARTRAALASYRAGRGELRQMLEAFEQEIDFILERAQLRNERGRAWAFLRYLGRQHP